MQSFLKYSKNMQVFTNTPDSVNNLCNSLLLPSMSEILSSFGSFLKYYIYLWPDDSFAVEVSNISYTCLVPIHVKGSISPKLQDLISSLKNRVSFSPSPSMNNETFTIYLYTPTLLPNINFSIQLQGLDFSLNIPKTSSIRTGGSLLTPHTEWMYIFHEKYDNLEEIKLFKQKKKIITNLESVLDRDF